MTKSWQPAAERYVDQIEAIRCLAHPLRLRMLDVLRRPATVKEVASALDEEPTRLYYHVHQLEEHGFLRVVSERLVSGIVEKHYQVTALRLALRNPLLSTDRLDADQTGALLADLLDRSRRELVQSLVADQVDPRDPPRHPFVTRKRLHLTEAQLDLVHQRLDALTRDLAEMSQPEGSVEANGEEAAREFILTLAFYLPTGDAEPRSHQEDEYDEA